MGTVFAMLIVAELFFRFLAPIPDPLAGAKSRDYPNQFIPSEFKPHMSLRTEAEPGLPGLSGQHMFTTNNVGLRGDSLAMPKPANEYRVFMIGGSTVECMYLDDTEAVTAVLQRGLGRTADGRVVKVYNAGKSGDRSDSHISMLVHRLVHLQPDLIVVMLGLNDLRISLAGFDFRHFDRRPAYTTAPAPPPLALHNFVVLAATEFQLGRRLYNLVVRATPRTARQVQETIALRSTARVAWEAAKKLRVSAREPHGDTAAFHRNVESLVGIAEGQEVPIVLVTQGSTWASPDTLNRWRWMWAVADSAYSEAGMKAGLDELNDVTRATARRHNVPLYDLARLIPPTGANYYDDAHFNVAGAALAGNELAKFIKGLDLPGLSRAVPAPAPAHRGEGAPR
ncbi:MAG: SGNH/GDSL hydrolase family protein [Gemmatimonadaceae bacterium]